jgi:hypothetical protein
MGIAESHAEEITKGKLGIVMKDARWRLEPATEKQLKVLDMYDVPYDRQITKGDASDVINVIFSGEKSTVR